MIGKSRNFIHTTAKSAEIISQIALSVCVIMAVSNTLLRYIFSKPIGFTEEFCVITLIYMVFMSLPILEKDDEHLRMTALYNIVPHKIRAAIDVIRSFVTIGLLSWFFVAGVNVVSRNFRLDVKTQAMNIPYAYVYLAIPVAFILVVLVRIFNITIKNKSN